MAPLVKGEKIVRTFDCTVKGVDEKNYTVTVLVSDGSIDRSGEAILPSAWVKRIGDYLANPLFCWGHPLTSEDPQPEDVIGCAEEVTVTEQGLICRFRYAVEDNPKAAFIFRMVKAGYLKAFSIGALVWDFVCMWDGEEMISKLPVGHQEAIKSGECWSVVTDAELLEVSQVIAGCNRSALIKAASASGFDARQLFENRQPRQAQPRKKEAAVLVVATADTAPAPDQATEEPATAEPDAPAVAELEPEQTPVDSTEQLTEDQQFEAMLEEYPELAEALFELLEDLLL